ncbi:MAG TPA: signal peptide peptidase SppA [Phototrophicaceae bacterium]|nr:signal peptide peptidase SppA [Phototrophicaceae bacterium]
MRKTLKRILSAIIQTIGKLIGRVNPLYWLRRGLFILRNFLRRWAELDYVLFTLSGEIPALPVERGFIEQRIFGEPAMSLLDLEHHLELIASDPRPKGVIFYLRDLQLSLADLQTLRDSIQHFRKSGKRVICYAQDYDLKTYYIASVADEIILQPGGVLMTLGLSQQAIFLKDALAQVGVSFDAVAISPYKGAFDQLTRDTISSEGREQLEWLLDSRFEILVNDIATGRQVTPEAVRTMIDGAPHLDTTALTDRYVDTVLNEEYLGEHLKAEHLVPWKQAERKLFRRWRKRQHQYVALLEINGTIIAGESQQPPPIPIPVPLPVFGDAMTGDATVVRQVRQLMQDEDAAAVILYVDSPGGSAQASEAMTSALVELAKTRPLVVYMNGVAASGGYYVSTPARWIVAQPGTITGSIGVLTGKPISTGIFEKLHVNRLDFERGASASIFSDAAPFTEPQRAVVKAMIERIYGQFVERVAQSRHLTTEQVDAIGGGRVWTGIQAKANGLVDELGGLQVALMKARTLANLSEDAPLIAFKGDDKPFPPQLAEAANPAAGLNYVYTAVRKTFNGMAQVLMPFELK